MNLLTRCENIVKCEKFTGILLAGGESKRFGKPKAFALKGSKPFYVHSLEALKPFVEKIIIVTNKKLHHRFPFSSSIEVIHDFKEYKGNGPLAGIYSTMEIYFSEWYVVAPVDVPFIEQEVYGELIKHVDNDYDAIVPIATGKIHPLIALYRSSLKEKIKNKLDEGNLSVRRLLKDVQVKYVQFDNDMPFYNINNQKEYKKYLK